MAEGFLLIDPSHFDAAQASKCCAWSTEHRGWLHPDGVRWIVPVEMPTHKREGLIRDGWPAEAIIIAR